jgi:gas vesicle protein
MPDYQNSKIYELVCSETGKRYIGSTTQKLCKRLWEHKTPKNHCVSRHLVNPKIYLLENVPCNSKEELLSIERKYIENNECINYYIPTRTSKQYREQHKERLKEWKKEHYQTNKDTIQIKRKEYYEKNKEQITIKNNEYKEKHKEDIKIWKHNWYEEHKKEQLKKQGENFTCDCGAILSYGNRSRHFKTQKHINYINNLSL